jgi:hypothetical protein
MYVFAWMTDLALQQADLANEDKFKAEFDRWIEQERAKSWLEGFMARGESTSADIETTEKAYEWYKKVTKDSHNCEACNHEEHP